jgi:hypothetical protein
MTSLVGSALDDLGFVRDLKAVIAVISGAHAAKAVHDFGISRKRLDALVANAGAGGRAAVVRVRDDPRPLST